MVATSMGGWLVPSESKFYRTRRFSSRFGILTLEATCGLVRSATRRISSTNYAFEQKTEAIQKSSIYLYSVVVAGRKKEVKSTKLESRDGNRRNRIFPTCIKHP